MKEGQSEKTLCDRIDEMMNGATIKEAEDVGVMILSQVVAKRSVTVGHTREYLTSVVARIITEADRFIIEHRRILSVFSPVSKQQGKKTKTGPSEEPLKN